MDLCADQAIQHYRIVEKLGEGGVGQVYKALDIRLHRHVALKVLRSGYAASPEHRARFLQEARAASALNHPNIITIHDILTHEGADFMVMELVTGQSLAGLIRRGGLRISALLTIGAQVADALATAHEAGIIHRDLKPGNIMFSNAGNVKLLDFGLAKLTGPRALGGETEPGAPLTTEGMVVGTARYMSPEQAQGLPIDARSDIFTLGVVLYEMATGFSAFEAATTVSTLAAVLRDEPRPIPELTRNVPSGLVDLIARSMQKDPSARPATMREVHCDLLKLRSTWESGTQAPLRLHLPASGACASIQPVPAEPASPMPFLPAPPSAPVAAPSSLRAAIPVKRKQSAWVWLALAAFAVITAGALVWRQPAGEPAPPPALSVTPAPATEVRGQTPTEPGPTAISAHARAPKAPQPQFVSATVSEGIPLLLELDQEVLTTVQAGESLKLRAAEDLKVGDLIIIRRGAPARAVVAKETRNRRLLPTAKATMLLQTVNAVDGQDVPVRESRSSERKPRPIEPERREDRSQDKTVLAPKGAKYTAYIDGGVTIQATRPVR